MPQATEPGGIERATLLPLLPTGKCAIASLFGLAPGGVYQAPGVTTGTGALLPHRFTLTEEKRAAALPFFASSWRFVFCGTFLRVTPTGRYPAPCSMEPGLSSPCYAARSDHLISFPLLSPPVGEHTSTAMLCERIVVQKGVLRRWPKQHTLTVRTHEQFILPPNFRNQLRLYLEITSPTRPVLHVDNRLSMTLCSYFLIHGIELRLKAINKLLTLRLLNGNPLSQD